MKDTRGEGSLSLSVSLAANRIESKSNTGTEEVWLQMEGMYNPELRKHGLIGRDTIASHEYAGSDERQLAYNRVSPVYLWRSVTAPLDKEATNSFYSSHTRPLSLQ